MHRAKTSSTLQRASDKQRNVIPNFIVLNGKTFFGFHALPRHEAERLYAGLVRYANPCGCRTGGICALLSICICLLVGVYLPIMHADPVSATWQLGVVVAIAGGVAGKCIGLWWAYHRFESLRREFETLTNNQVLVEECGT